MLKGLGFKSCVCQIVCYFNCVLFWYYHWSWWV